MAYMEMKLEKGEAKDLFNLWNSGMTGPKKKRASGKTAKKAAPVKKAGKKNSKK